MSPVWDPRGLAWLYLRLRDFGQATAPLRAFFPSSVRGLSSSGLRGAGERVKWGKKNGGLAPARHSRHGGRDLVTQSSAQPHTSCSKRGTLLMLPSSGSGRPGCVSSWATH